MGELTQDLRVLDPEDTTDSLLPALTAIDWPGCELVAWYIFDWVPGEVRRVGGTRKVACVLHLVLERECIYRVGVRALIDSWVGIDLIEVRWLHEQRYDVPVPYVPNPDLVDAVT